MTTYAAIADLIAAMPRGQQELIELTDRTGTGAYDAAKATRALTAAANLIDSYVAQVTTLPLASVPPILRDCAVDIARHELWGDAASEEVRKRRDDRLGWLRDLVLGRASLGLPAGNDPQLQNTARRGEVASGISWDCYP